VRGTHAKRPIPVQGWGASHGQTHACWRLRQVPRCGRPRPPISTRRAPPPSRSVLSAMGHIGTATLEPIRGGLHVVHLPDSELHMSGTRHLPASPFFADGWAPRTGSLSPLKGARITIRYSGPGWACAHPGTPGASGVTPRHPTCRAWSPGCYARPDPASGACSGLSTGCTISTRPASRRTRRVCRPHPARRTRIPACRPGATSAPTPPAPEKGECHRRRDLPTPWASSRPVGAGDVARCRRDPVRSPVVTRTPVGALPAEPPDTPPPERQPSGRDPV
jgi:hypothetical protein